MKSIITRNYEENIFKESRIILEEAFPEDERRILSKHQKLLLNDNFRNEIFIENEEVIGLLYWWEFEDVIYIENFATKGSIRGKGIGKEILQSFISSKKKNILLEVEKPELAIHSDEKEIRERRINFYKRNGFNFNLHPYEFPSYEHEGKYLEFYIMSFPNTISEEYLNNFKQKYLKIIQIG